MTPFTTKLTALHAVWSLALNALDDAKEARRRTDATLNAKLRSPGYVAGTARAESMTARAARLRLEAAQLDEAVAYGAFDGECDRLRGLGGAARQEELREDPQYQARLIRSVDWAHPNSEWTTMRVIDIKTGR